MDAPLLSRHLPPPAHLPTFLFGLRGSGKSTWARLTLPTATTVDLRDDAVYRPLRQQPSRLRTILEAVPIGEWTVIDEIQRLPKLLDVIHQVLELDQRRPILMTGSGARAIERAGYSLLGGRAALRVMPPFLAADLGAAFDLESACRYGLLPQIVRAADPGAQLSAYLATYIEREIAQEARVRDLDSWAMALRQFALRHGRVLTMSTLAADAQVSRKTAVGYLDLMRDMHLAALLPVYGRAPNTRDLAEHPKFYFTDSGLAMGLLFGRSESLGPALGEALEGIVFHHLATWVAHAPGARLATWRTSLGAEVDFVVETPDRLIAIEVKHGTGLTGSAFRGLRAFGERYPAGELILAAPVSVPERHGTIRVVPIEGLLKAWVPGRAFPA